MKKKMVAYLVGGAALYWWLAKGGLGLKGLAEDIFGEDMMSAGIMPTDINPPVMQYPPGYQYSPYGGQQYGYPQYGGGYPQYPINSYGGPGSTVAPQYPYGYPGGASYGAGYPYGYPQQAYPGMAPSNYQTPYTTYPPISNPSIWSSLFGGSSFGGVPTPQISAAESVMDSYIQYGLQAQLLQQQFCGTQIPGHSQYWLCTFSWTNSRGKQRTGNYRAAANAIKAYQRNGKLN